MELESALVSEPNKLQDRIRQLFGVVRASLNEGLNGGNSPAAAVASAKPAEARNSHNGSTPGASNGIRRATQSQIKALFAITKKERVDLPTFLRERFQVQRPDDLTIQQASLAIDALKESVGKEDKW
jgi:hypothetical protein